ncbi:hypothetical protein BDV93DRAFT_131482 [Ceratobasidium sp. AG-I]|nr:hypothetical protein BDV93DRAFT_131482 [Ceratobasidium sp. AG-I]
MEDYIAHQWFNKNTKAEVILSLIISVLPPQSLLPVQASRSPPQPSISQTPTPLLLRPRPPTPPQKPNPFLEPKYSEPLVQTCPSRLQDAS